MILKVAALLLMAAGVCTSCDCTEPSVKVKRDHADIIFRGTIIDLKTARSDVSPGLSKVIGNIVVFRITRVWKGTVGQTFEMPAVEETSLCLGFSANFLKVGEDLLVYAWRRSSPWYFTDICGNHKPAIYAERDFKLLGRGQEPGR